MSAAAGSLSEAEMLRRLQRMAQQKSWDGKCGCGKWAIGKQLYKYETADALYSALGAHAFNCRLKAAPPSPNSSSSWDMVHVSVLASTTEVAVMQPQYVNIQDPPGRETVTAFIDECTDQHVLADIVQDIMKRMITLSTTYHRRC